MRSLFWIVIAIIVYGSLYPFNFEWVAIDSITWQDWGVTIAQRTTNGDILSNVLTFLPLGYFAYQYNPLKTHSQWHLIGQILIIGFVFAYLLQMIQFFIPSRVPAVGDALFNLLGIGIGVALAVWVERLLVKNAEIAKQWPLQHAAQSLLAVFWLLYQLFPFVPVFSWSNLETSVHGLIIEPTFIWSYWLFQSILWASFFQILRDNPWYPVNWKNGLILILGNFLLRLLVAHNHFDWGDLLASICGLGFILSIPKNKTLQSISLTLLVGIVFSSFFPWFIKLFTSDFNWLPFSRFLSGSMWVNTHVFLEKVFVYGCLYFFFSSWLKNKAGVFIGGVVGILVIEIAQLFISFDRADITEPILFILVAYSIEKLSQYRDILAYSDYRRFS